MSDVMPLPTLKPRHFYKPQPLRPLEEILTDILALEQETEGLLVEIVGGGAITSEGLP